MFTFGKHKAQMGAILTVVGAAIGVLFALQIAPVISSSILQAKNSYSSVTSIDNSSALAFNNSLNPVLPSYSLIPVALVFGAVLAAFLGLLNRG